MAQAFELREQHKNNFNGGTITHAGGKSFDLKQALDRGDGVIVAKDTELAERLSEVEALKPVDAPTKSKSKTSDK